jgi:hypothetical protein
MNLFRHPGLIIALFWCAAMVLVPMVAAVGVGPGADQPPGQAPGGQGIGPVQGNGQNSITPGQGTHPEETGDQTGRPGLRAPDWGNMTTTGNGTIRAPPEGNMTAPPDMPEWDSGNATERQGFGNMTPPPLPPEGDTGNATCMNQTRHGPVAGNQSIPVPPLQENGQNLDEQLSAGTLIDELISWLRARTGT